jgi:hypothetical protein
MFTLLYPLPADRVDLLVDTTDRCKSEGPDRLLWICQQCGNVPGPP